LFNNSEEIIHTLLDFGADPTMQDRDGMMALDYAEKNPELTETESYERLSEKTEAAIFNIYATFIIKNIEEIFF